MLSLIGRYGTLAMQGLGSYTLFSWHVFKNLTPRSLSRRLVFEQLDFIGTQSLLIIILAAGMVGAVFGLQFGEIFRLFGVESLIGAAASFALSKELAPVIGAFLVTGRCGSAMAAEIANMKIHDQIDAMQVMCVNPLNYLCAPRVLAAMIAVPLLAAVFMVVGVLAAFATGVLLYQVDHGIFIEKIVWITKPMYILQGLQKAVIFGAIFSTICCYKGMNARGGAKGVGQMTTSAVVLSLVTILISDFFISYFQVTKIF